MASCACATASCKAAPFPAWTLAGNYGRMPSRATQIPDRNQDFSQQDAGERMIKNLFAVLVAAAFAAACATTEEPKPAPQPAPAPAPAPAPQPKPAPPPPAPKPAPEPAKP